MLGAFLKAGINEFEISIKFCVVLIPILIFSKKNSFWVIIALFAYLKCKCDKNCTFSNILQKVKSYFFGNIYQPPFDSYWNSKKSIKLKPPSAYSPTMLRYFPRILRGRLNPSDVFSDYAERMKNTQTEIYSFNSAWGL